MGRRPTTAKLAGGLDLDESKVIEIVRYVGGPMSLSEPLRSDGDTEPGYLVEDRSVVPPLDAAAASLLAGEVAQLLVVLDDRERAILQPRFGLDGDEPPDPSRSRDPSNLTRERIHQIEALAGPGRATMLEEAQVEYDAPSWDGYEGFALGPRTGWSFESEPLRNAERRGCSRDGSADEGGGSPGTPGRAPSQFERTTSGRQRKRVGSGHTGGPPRAGRARSRPSQLARPGVMGLGSARREVDCLTQLEYPDRAQGQHEEGAERDSRQKCYGEGESPRGGNEADLGPLRVLKDEDEDDCQDEQRGQHLDPRPARSCRGHTWSLGDVPLAAQVICGPSHATLGYHGRFLGSHWNPQSSPEHGSTKLNVSSIPPYHHPPCRCPRWLDLESS